MGTCRSAGAGVQRGIGSYKHVAPLERKKIVSMMGTPKIANAKRRKALVSVVRVRTVANASPTTIAMRPRRRIADRVFVKKMSRSVIAKGGSLRGNASAECGKTECDLWFRFQTRFLQKQRPPKAVSVEDSATALQNLAEFLSGSRSVSSHHA